MIDIEHIQSGDALLLTEFGVSTEGTILHVDRETEAFVYETHTGEQDTILLKSNSIFGGNYYDVYRHSATGTVVANFKGWHSDKYVKY